MSEGKNMIWRAVLDENTLDECSVADGSVVHGSLPDSLAPEERARCRCYQVEYTPHGLTSATLDASGSVEMHDAYMDMWSRGFGKDDVYILSRKPSERREWLREVLR